MATLPRMESGRMQAVGISGAVTPNVQAQAPSYTGIQRAVSANQQMAQTLDRLSGSLFNTAALMRQSRRLGSRLRTQLQTFSSKLLLMATLNRLI